MLTMVLYPDVYEKAQAEIDRVIGPDRMPDLDDRDSLPYLEAVIMEVYRYAVWLLQRLSTGLLQFCIAGTSPSR